MGLFGDEPFVDPAAEAGAGEGEQEELAAEAGEEEQPGQGEEAEAAEEEAGDNPEDEGPIRTKEDLAKAWKAKQQPAPTTPQQPAQPAMSEQELTDIFFTNFEKNPLATMQYLIDQVVGAKTAVYDAREQEHQLAANMDPIVQDYVQVRSEQGMTQLFERVADIARELGNPRLAQNPTQRVLRMAAQELWPTRTADVYKAAVAEGREAAAADRRAKSSAQINTTTKRQAAPPQKSEADQIADSIVDAGRGRGLFRR